jgi:carboxylesterase
VKPLAKVGAGIALAVGAGMALLFRPLPLRLRRNQPSNPATSYAEALERLASIQAAEAESGVKPRCRSTLYAHDRPTSHVWLLLHGYTNCPYQFVQLAERLHALGHTIFAPLAPGHGLSGQWQARLGRVTASEALRWANEMVDLAHGLGEQVHVLGFSFGGGLAAWLAQTRPDVAGVMIVSAALELLAVPAWRRGLYANLLGWLPDQTRWWDPVRREAREGPSHAYPGFSTRGVGVILRLGLLVQEAASRRGPRTPNVTIVMNTNDDVVDNRAAERLAECWRHHGAMVTTYTFPVSLNLIHDLMDPGQPQQQVDVAYPILLELLARQMTTCETALNTIRP